MWPALLLRQCCEMVPKRRISGGLTCLYNKSKSFVCGGLVMFSFLNDSDKRSMTSQLLLCWLFQFEAVMLGVFWVVGC